MKILTVAFINYLDTLPNLYQILFLGKKNKFSNLYITINISVFFDSHKCSPDQLRSICEHISNLLYDWLFKQNSPRNPVLIPSLRNNHFETERK